MSGGIKVAMIGLDSSHSVAFAQRMQGDTAPEQRVGGMQVVACMRFETPFQDKKGLDERQQKLQGWGIRVTESFKEAIADCDAIMLEINDPNLHLEYFKKVAGLGKPVFLDKPLAGTVKDGRAILRLAAKHSTRMLSCSSLRFGRGLIEAVKELQAPVVANVFGALGKAPAGDSLVWYGVHAFEMLERIMGASAAKVAACESPSSVVAVVDYPDGRQGVVEVRNGFWTYGGRLQTKERTLSFVVDSRWTYTDQLHAIRHFFQTGKTAVTPADAFEVLAMMEAARQSIETGKPARVAKA